MSIEEMKEHIVSGFMGNIEEIASDFAKEFCDALNEAERAKKECEEWKRRAKIAEKNDKIKELALENLSRKHEIMMGFSENETDLYELTQSRFNDEIKQAEREIEEKSNE